MAKTIVKNPVITVNGVDLTNRCDKATINTKFDDVDLTVFGDTYKEHGQGLGDASIALEFFQDFDVGEVDATLWPLSQSGATFPVTIKPFNAAVSTSNPLYSMTGVLLDYTPLDAQPGQASKTPVTIMNGAQAGLTRATS